MHHDRISQIEQALGSEVVHELADAELLRHVEVPVATGAPHDRVASRVQGAVFGAALGDALVARLGSAPTTSAEVEAWLLDGAGAPSAVSAATQLFVQSAEAWMRHGWSAPPVIADELVLRAPGLRAPGAAVRRAVRGLEQGRPWHRAASGSYGDAVLPRAVAVGLAAVGTPERASWAASLDAVVTHRSKSAALCSATLAALTVALVHRPDGGDWRTVAGRVVASVDHQPTRELLTRALDRPDVPPVAEDEIHPHADRMLATALWAQHAGDPIRVLIAALGAGDGNRSAAVVAGALAGIIHGVDALPPRTDHVEGTALLLALSDRLAAASGPVSTDRRDDVGASAGTDIWFLLDRSGSMQAIAAEVVAGFDRFFAEQRGVGGDATVTIVQFDSDDPHDVIVDARPLRDVRSIGRRFEPRSATPLYDAIGRLLDRAERHGGVPEDQLVVIFTDGLENASTDWTRQRVFARISRLRSQGWTFVFLGANQDSYEVGGGMAMAAGNVSNFRAEPASVAASYEGLSRSVRAFRGKDRTARRRDQDDFWGGVKEGEQR